MPQPLLGHLGAVLFVFIRHLLGLCFQQYPELLHWRVSPRPNNSPKRAGLHISCSRLDHSPKEPQHRLYCGLGPVDT
jgi:hypothetical protein